MDVPPPRPRLDWSGLREALPEDVDGLAADADALDPFTLDVQMRGVLRAMRRLDWQLGRLPRVFLDRRLYRLMLFPSASRYVTERLGLSARKARALVVRDGLVPTAPPPAGASLALAGRPPLLRLAGER